MADEIAADPRTLSGLEILRAIVEGRGPVATICTALDFDLVEVGEGVAVFEGRPSDRVLNPFGTVHGGYALTLIDSCTGCAAYTLLPAGVGYTTVETKVNFVRAMTPDTGRVRAEGRVVAQGRTIVTAEGKVTDAQGKLLAHGTSTLMVLRS